MLDEIFKRFVNESPVTVMVGGLLGSSRNIIVPLSQRDGRNVHKPLWQPRQPLPSLFQRGHGFLG